MSDFPKQKSFGDFIRERHGSNWVYAARTTPDLLARHNKPDQPVVVITPKMQRQLAVDYAKQWGREHDVQYWQMMCALSRCVHTLKVHHHTDTEAYRWATRALVDAETPRRFT